MDAVIGAVFSIIFVLWTSGYGIHRLHDQVRAMALEKVHQGLPPLSSYTERLTCQKFNANGEFVKSTIPQCRRLKRRG